MATEISQPEIRADEELPTPRQTAARAPKNRDEISLLDLLIILLERRRFILWFTAACAILAVIVSLILPKTYTATVTLLPPQQNSSTATLMATQLGSLGGLGALAGNSFGLKNPNDMYVGMLKSRTVEDAMVQRFELMKEYKAKYPSDARKAFEKHVTIDGSSKDSLIHISIEDHDPNRAMDLANGYVDQYRVLSERLAISEASQRRLFFQKELELAKDNLAKAEEAFRQTQQETGVIQLDSQARALIESAASLRAQVAAKEVQIQGMQTYATSENADLVQAQRELEGLRAQLAKLGGSENSPRGEIIVPEGKVPQAGLEYIRKYRDVKYNETIFDILAKQFEVAKLDEAKQGALIQVVDPAIVPDRRTSPKRALIVLVATSAGLFIAVFLALLQTGFQRMKEDPETSEKLAVLRRTMWR